MREVYSNTWTNTKETTDDKQQVLYEKLRRFTDFVTCEVAYPSSILDGIQTGRIFVDDLANPHAAIFWHYCGMAYVVGDTDDSDFKKGLYQLLNKTFEEKQREFYLIVPYTDTNWIDLLDTYVTNESHIQKRERLPFSFDKQQFAQMNFVLPAGYSYFEIGEEHYKTLKGRVIPTYSWDKMEDYLRYGKGFGIIDDSNGAVVSTAFSSGIGAGKIDIGIETYPDYRRKGFATLIAAKMANYILKHGLTPDWGCDSGNPGSAATAMSIGFQPITRCAVYTYLA